jgi:hypothetical protein
MPLAEVLASEKPVCSVDRLTNGWIVATRHSSRVNLVATDVSL